MFYSGSSGGIKFGKAGVVDGKANNEEGTGWKALDTRVTNWTLNVTAQLLDTTTLGDYDKSSVYGLRTTTGSRSRLLLHRHQSGRQRHSQEQRSQLVYRCPYAGRAKESGRRRTACQPHRRRVDHLLLAALHRRQERQQGQGLHRSKRQHHQRWLMAAPLANLSLLICRLRLPVKSLSTASNDGLSR